jgi:hypothetical protein
MVDPWDSFRSLNIPYVSVSTETNTGCFSIEHVYIQTVYLISNVCCFSELLRTCVEVGLFVPTLSLNPPVQWESLQLVSELLLPGSLQEFSHFPKCSMKRCLSASIFI